MTDRDAGPYALSLADFDRLVRVPEEAREEWVPALPPSRPVTGTSLVAGGGAAGDLGACDGDGE